MSRTYGSQTSKEMQRRRGAIYQMPDKPRPNLVPGKRRIRPAKSPPIYNHQVFSPEIITATTRRNPHLTTVRDSKDMGFVRPNGDGLQTWFDNGLTGFILHEGPHALKIPRVVTTHNMSESERDDEEYINEGNRELLRREGVVYQKLGSHGSIAEFLGISENGLLLKYYPRGNLKHYISKNPDISEKNKSTWILNLVEAYVHLHRCKILLYDAALRNLLISDDFTLKMIDFAQCTCFETEVDINTVIDEDGMSAKCNIFDLGVLIYSIVIWEEFKYDLFETKFKNDPLDIRWVLPPLSELPNVEHVFCGELIGGCWSGRFKSMEEVEREARPLLEEALRAEKKAKLPMTIVETLRSAILQLLTYMNRTVRYRI